MTRTIKKNRMDLNAFFAVFFLICVVFISNVYAINVEDNVDRPGKDYKNFNLPIPDYKLCMQACEKDPNCKAYTYVKPGVQGKTARCWLKSSVPKAKESSCCVSGVKNVGITTGKAAAVLPGNSTVPSYKPTINRAVSPIPIPKPAAMPDTLPKPEAAKEHYSHVSAPARSGETVQYDTDRPGKDYTHFDMTVADPNQCRQACYNDSRCRAFTYVKPGIQGPQARCWLKDAVPAPRSSSCCISGVKSGSRQTDSNVSPKQISNQAKPKTVPAIGDYEVRVYQYPNYVGTYRSFALKQGMRQLLVSDLGAEWRGRISSIKLGRKVRVWVFDLPDFGGLFYASKRYVHSNGEWRIREPSSNSCIQPRTPSQWYKVDTVQSENQTRCVPNYEVMSETWVNEIASLIIFPKEMGSPEGVLLLSATEKYRIDKGGIWFFRNESEMQETESYIFLPAPQNGKQLLTQKPSLPDWLNDGVAFVKFTHPGLQLTLYKDVNFKGKSLTLPGDGRWQGTLDLRNFDFAKDASSAKLTASEAAVFIPSKSQTHAGYSSQTHQRAPPSENN